MNQEMRRWFLALAVSLGVCIMAAPTAGATTTVSSVTYKGLSTAVNYYKAHGCSVLYAYTRAYDQLSNYHRLGTDHQINLIAGLDFSNQCYPDLRGSFYQCYTNSGTVSISKNLGAASVAGTLTCENVDNSYDTCEITQSETLQGDGSTGTRYHGSYSYHVENYNYSVHGISTYKRATVTDASISGCRGIALTEQDATSAEISSSSGGSTTVSRG